MKATAIFTAPKSTTPFLIKPRHEAIIRALHDYEYLNADHLQRLFFGKGSVNYPYHVMKPLVENGYCYVAKYYKKDSGKPEYQWHLDRKGNAYLRELGIEPKRRLRKDKLPTDHRHWEHLIAVNHCLISGELLAREHSQITRHLMIHDLDFHRLKIRVPMPDGTTREVDPDGLVDFRLHERGKVFKQTILFEVDRNTNDRKNDWTEKITKNTAYILGPLREQGMTKVHNAVLTTDAARQQMLTEWTMEALLSINAPEPAAQYYFTTTDPKTITAADFFLAPQWRFFDAEAPVPIIHLSGQ